MAENTFEYEISYSKAADKFFNQHEDIRGQYEDAIRRLMANDHPESVDMKRIRGTKNSYYRIRIGGYRVVYTIINGRLIVIMTVLAGPRGDVYKRMKSLE